MELLGDVGHLESRFFLFRDKVMSAQDRCMVSARHTIVSEILLDTPTEPLGEEAQVEARFSPFGDTANFDAR